jgi:hypothetical protein
MAVCVAAALGLVAIALLIVVVLYERQRLARWELGQIAARTGAAIGAARIDLGITTGGIEIVAHDVTLVYHGDHARVLRLRALVGYRELGRMTVLPLKSVSIVSAAVELAPGRSAAPFNFSRILTTIRSATLKVGHVSSQVRVTSARIRLPRLADASVVLDGRIDAGSRGTHIAVERLAWTGPPLDGLTAAGNFTIPAAQGQPASGNIALIQRARTEVRGKAAMSARAGVLVGNLDFAVTSAHFPGKVGFSGIYSIGSSRLELRGALLNSGALGIGKRVPVAIEVASPFTADPKIDTQAGPFNADLAQFSSAFGGAAPTITGTATVSTATLGVALGPIRAALTACANSGCEVRRGVVALLRSAQASMSVTAARFEDSSLPTGAVRLDAPVQLILDHGFARVRGLAASMRSIAISRGNFSADLRDAFDSSSPVVPWSGTLYSTLRLSPLDWQSSVGQYARLIRLGGRAWAQVRLKGVLAKGGAGFVPSNLRAQMRHGFLWLIGRHREAIFFRGNVALAGGRLRAAASARLEGGGMLALRGRYGLARKSLDARLAFQGLDLRRWTRTLIGIGALKGLMVAGLAEGSATIERASSGAPPRFQGNARVTALTVGSRFTRTPVFVPAARIVANDSGAQIWLNHARAGAGNFNLHAAVTDFAAPKIHLAVTGASFDFDSIHLGQSSSVGHEATQRMLARRVTFDGSVKLGRVYIHHVMLRDFSCKVRGLGRRWRLVNLVAHAMGGAIRMRAAWDGHTDRLYVAGDAYHLNTRHLFAELARRGGPNVTGTLQARLNLGILLAGGKPPQPLCGTSVILMKDGTLGNIDVLSQILDVASLRSWLPFAIPRFDVGIPYDRLTIRTALSPHALDVQHIQLSSDAFALAGHGSVSIPSHELNIHVVALPFASMRDVGSHIPLAGSRTDDALDRIFAVRIHVSGTSSSPQVSPELAGNPLEALIDIIELPLDFEPDSDLPSGALFRPRHVPSYRRSCSPYQG